MLQAKPMPLQLALVSAIKDQFATGGADAHGRHDTTLAAWLQGSAQAPAGGAA